MLDNDTLQYNRLTWSDDGNRLAVLKGRPVERMRERDNVLIALSNLRTLRDDPEVAPSRLDPSTASGFPKGFVVSDRTPLSWSEDGRRIFLGIIPQPLELILQIADRQPHVIGSMAVLVGG